ncbi:hypothetical protein H312_00719 [Anncaliia algerae PRA339]|uniref:Uncharacterized protein n=1 Tax=Anncaliia algerae PRA339 TaxID=1288291 RepID=A0A059F3M9_9MICR|nr:hypothetical protein H312_00719 [Anncaliia algerae PRA339]
MKISEILTFIESSNELNFYNWLVERDILKQEMVCIHCRKPMFIKTKMNCYFEKSLRCINFGYSKYGTNMSIITDSFFKDIAINPRICLRAILYILNGLRLSNIIKFMNISYKTSVKIKSKIIIKIKEFFCKNLIKLGGEDIIVHVDETMLSLGKITQTTSYKRTIMGYYNCRYEFFTKQRLL